MPTDRDTCPACGLPRATNADSGVGPGVRLLCWGHIPPHPEPFAALVHHIGTEPIDSPPLCPRCETPTKWVTEGGRFRVWYCPHCDNAERAASLATVETERRILGLIAERDEARAEVARLRAAMPSTQRAPVGRERGE
jgi:ribosomal protein L37AE/L43A